MTDIPQSPSSGIPGNSHQRKKEMKKIKAMLQYLGVPFSARENRPTTSGDQPTKHTTIGNTISSLGVGVAAVLYLFNRTPATTLIALLILLGSFVYPTLALVGYWKNKTRAKLAFAFAMDAVVVAAIAWAAWPEPPPAVALSLSMKCDQIFLPINIPPATTIHVIKVDPTGLNFNPRINGVFQDISSSGANQLTWPTEHDGRWMTLKEKQEIGIEKSTIPMPSAMNCRLTNNSSVTLDDLAIPLLIDTSDSKRHSYQILFDPIMSGKEFDFYVVNGCSSGQTPTVIQWADGAKVRILGARDSRVIPLQFSRTNWPSGLLGFGVSAFIWRGTGECHWKQ